MIVGILVALFSFLLGFFLGQYFGHWIGQAEAQAWMAEKVKNLWAYLFNIIVILVVGTVFAYGFIRFCYDVGIVVYDAKNEPHFWFEEDLNNWIWRK